jgi:hypothetical protein
MKAEYSDVSDRICFGKKSTFSQSHNIHHAGGKIALMLQFALLHAGGTAHNAIFTIILHRRPLI